MTIIISGSDSGEAVSAVTSNYDNLQEPRLRVTNLTQAEIATIEGDRFEAQYVGTIPAGDGQEIVLQFTMPDNTVLTGFLNRFLRVTEDVDFELYWDPTGLVKGASLDIFNTNQIDNSPSLMDYTLVTSYTTEGTLREQDFIIASIQGVAQTSGEITPDTGFRIYDPNRVAMVKLINRSTSVCRVQLTYTWVEAPTGL